MATIGACAGFAAICGSSTATVATMGSVALPEMKKFKYDPALATGCIAAGGSMGILIPPSYQNLDGPQLGMDWRAMAGVQYAWKTPFGL